MICDFRHSNKWNSFDNNDDLPITLQWALDLHTHLKETKWEIIHRSCADL